MHTRKERENFAKFKTENRKERNIELYTKHEMRRERGRGDMKMNTT